MSGSSSRPTGPNHKDKGRLSSVVGNTFLSGKFPILLGDTPVEILVTTTLYPAQLCSFSGFPLGTEPHLRLPNTLSLSPPLGAAYSPQPLCSLHLSFLLKLIELQDFPSATLSLPSLDSKQPDLSPAQWPKIGKLVFQILSYDNNFCHCTNQ